MDVFLDLAHRADQPLRGCLRQADLCGALRALAKTIPMKLFVECSARIRVTAGGDETELRIRGRAIGASTSVLSRLGGFEGSAFGICGQDRRQKARTLKSQ
ncbi:MAG: hypothetical protein ABI885_24185 [Gammaproteobacteria bacterium]